MCSSRKVFVRNVVYKPLSEALFFILRLGSELATNERMQVSLITLSVRHVATESSQ